MRSYFIILLVLIAVSCGCLDEKTTTTTLATTTTTQPGYVHCDANNPCKEGDCYLFPVMSFAYCYVGDPCQECPTKSCRIAESYPMQVFCDKAGRAEVYAGKRE